MDIGLMAVILAIVVEAVVEYFKSILKLFSGKDKKPAILQCFAIVAAVAVSFAARVDLFKLFQVTLAYEWVGFVFTGIVISRGANYISDLIGRVIKFKNNIPKI